MLNVSASPGVRNGTTQNGGELQQICSDLVDVAMKGGEMMLKARPSALTTGSKKNGECSTEAPLEQPCIDKLLMCSGN